MNIHNTPINVASFMLMSPPSPSRKHTKRKTLSSLYYVYVVSAAAICVLLFGSRKLVDLKEAFIASSSNSYYTTISMISKKQNTNYVNGTYTATATTTTTTTTIKDHSPTTPLNSSSFDWNATSLRLCPNMVPQSHIGPQLFALARREFGDNVASCTSTNVSHQDAMSNVFYEWWWPKHVYQVTQNKTAMSYLGIWKCANNGISNYFKANNFKSIRRRGNYNIQQECVVTAIRDPISHFLSGYNEVEFRIERSKQRQQLFVPGGWKFGKIPIESHPKERFKQFLIDILSCPFERHYRGIFKTKERYPRSLELSHLYSMSGVLYHLNARNTTHSTPAVQQFDLMTDFHYLPSLTNISTRWGPFLAKKCGDTVSFNDIQMSKLLNNSITVAPNKHNSSLQKSYDKIKLIVKEKNESSLQITKALCVLHLLDYACWKDLPDGVPTVCMNLYASYHEKGLLPV